MPAMWRVPLQRRRICRLEEGKDIKYGGGGEREKERDARYTGIERRGWRWLRREEEGIAGSECKSTASDQSTTRTTRNRKDFSLSFHFREIPSPPPSSFPPLAARPFISSLCLLARYFSVGGVWLVEVERTRPSSRGTSKNLAPSQTRFYFNRARSRDRWFIDVILTGGGNQITVMTVF